TLIAIFGSIGQLLAMFLLVYLSFASSGGTTPNEALPGLFRTVGHVEPLRNTLLGTRAILYFGARGDAGLTTSLIVLASELVFCAAVGVGATFWFAKQRPVWISADPIDPLPPTDGRAVAERTVHPLTDCPASLQRCQQCDSVHSDRDGSTA